MTQFASTSLDDVVKAEHARCAALIAGEPGPLQAVYTDDFSYVHSSGRTEGRASYLTSVTSGQNKFLSFSHSDLKVEMLGTAGDVALMTGTVEMVRANGTVVFLFAEIWVHGADGWKLKYQHNTKKAA